jgi:WD40 repeat protein
MGLEFAPDSQTIVSAGAVDGMLKVHGLMPFREKAVHRLQIGWITRLVFSPDGQMLAVAGGSFHRPGEVRLLDWPACVERRRFTVATNTVSCVVFSRDGKTLIAGSTPSVSPFSAQREGGLYRWDVIGGAPLPPPPIARIP